MKYSKVAVVVAGSVMAMGAAAPAFAADAAPAMPTSINGGVDQLFAAQPVAQAGNAYLGPVVDVAKRVSDKLKTDTTAGTLLGQVTDATKDLTPTLAGVAKGTSLLGGLPIGH
ncbi:hypothetical protein [Streptomyces sp. SPB162]|uniref:hypothetical protein n=1 Tax=Streptomyces sp. SPB162 TaxID=2940560 RepID=UPI002406A7D2|nr:hypothetical protein [Streptomyces sp. SPB162]MDF9814564.1 hypothetical protein [Streptomyces sp. SPB162]